MSRVTIFEVARLAGVPAKTVMRVVDQVPDVPPATADRVLAAISQLGYEPYRSGRDRTAANS